MESGDTVAITARFYAHSHCTGMITIMIANQLNWKCMAQRILVAFDESPQARAALRHALDTYTGADITVLHVNDPSEWVYTDMMGGYYSEEAAKQAEESAEELLSESQALAEEYGEEVTTTTAAGRAAKTIVEYAEENNIDHIVLGSHGRSGISRFLLGSVAETVARRSPASVTIIRENDAG